MSPSTQKEPPKRIQRKRTKGFNLKAAERLIRCLACGAWNPVSSEKDSLSRETESGLVEKLERIMGKGWESDLKEAQSSPKNSWLQGLYLGRAQVKEHVTKIILPKLKALESKSSSLSELEEKVAKWANWLECCKHQMSSGDVWFSSAVQDTITEMLAEIQALKTDGAMKGGKED